MKSSEERHQLFQLTSHDFFIQTLCWTDLFAVLFNIMHIPASDFDDLGGGVYAQSLYFPFIHLTKTDWKCTTCQEMCAVHGWCMNEAQPYPHEADSVTFPNTSCSICTPLPWAYSPWWALSSWAQSTFCHLSNVVQLSGRGAISITHSNRKMQISCGDKTFRLL